METVLIATANKEHINCIGRLCKAAEIDYKVLGIGPHCFNGECEWPVTYDIPPTSKLIILSWTEQAEYFKIVCPHIPQVAYIAINNLPDYFASMNTPHLISGSIRILSHVPHAHKFLLRNLCSLQAKDPLPASYRQGFFSYIHEYETRFPLSYHKFTNLKESLPEIEAYGKDRELVDFFVKMPSSKATIHLKDDGCVCYAVSHSISFGIPVLSDRYTLEMAYLNDILIHDVTGLVADNLEELKSYVDLLDNDDEYLDCLSARTRAFAASNLQITPEYVSRWKRFVNNV